MNIGNTLAERGSRYGEFSEHARITQNIKAAMQDSPNWAGLPPDMKEALEMGLHCVRGGDDGFRKGFEFVLFGTSAFEANYILCPFPTMLNLHLTLPPSC